MHHFIMKIEKFLSRDVTFFGTLPPQHLDSCVFGTRPLVHLAMPAQLIQAGDARLFVVVGVLEYLSVSDCELVTCSIAEVC